MVFGTNAMINDKNIIILTKAMS